MAFLHMRCKIARLQTTRPPPAPGRSANSSGPQQAKNWPGLVRSTWMRIVGSMSVNDGRLRVALDRLGRSRDNVGMNIPGRVQNGVVVLEGEMTLPEGAAVFVCPRTAPVIHVAKHQTPVVLPLFVSDKPGTIDLTNDRIAEILDRDAFDRFEYTWPQQFPSNNDFS